VRKHVCKELRIDKSSGEGCLITYRLENTGHSCLKKIQLAVL
jgi:hypothetical protein